MELEGIMLGEIRQTEERKILYNLIRMWNLFLKKSHKRRSYLRLPEMGHCGWGKEY